MNTILNDVPAYGVDFLLKYGADMIRIVPIRNSDRKTVMIEASHNLAHEMKGAALVQAWKSLQKEVGKASNAAWRDGADIWDRSVISGIAEKAEKDLAGTAEFKRLNQKFNK